MQRRGRVRATTLSRTQARSILCWLHFGSVLAKWPKWTSTNFCTGEMCEKHDWFCMIRYDLKPRWENLSAIDGPRVKGIYVRCSPIKLGINAHVGNVTAFLSPCDAANVVTRHLLEWLQLHCCLWLWPAMPLSQCGLQYCVSRSFRFWEFADACLFGTRRIWNVTLQGCTTTCDAKACGSIGCAQISATIGNPYRALQRNQRRRRTSKASRAVGKQKPRLQRTSRRTTCELQFWKEFYN